MGPRADVEGMSWQSFHLNVHQSTHSTTIQLSKSLGNIKPPVLIKTERLLWETLLAIATGEEPVYKAMHTFFLKVDWDEIAMVSELDQAHFSEGQYCLKPKLNYRLIMLQTSRCQL